MDADLKTKTEGEVLFGDLDKPSLHALSYSLRHPDTWPLGFVWDYSECRQCAMGLAHHLWKINSPVSDEPDVAVSFAARTFAMPYADAQRVFLGHVDWVPREIEWRWAKLRSVSVCNFDLVTPEMVADQIDSYLARAE